MHDTDPPWLHIYYVSMAEPLAAARGVSEIARSNRGFLTAYKLAGGEPSMLGRDPHSGKYWTEVRRRAINRFESAARRRREKWWLTNAKGTRPSRRHLSLVMWAYSPTPDRLVRWLQEVRR